MDNETEMIKHQMEETRSDLTDKLETLEQQVVETVQGTTHAVSDTVENVKETVEKVKDSVTSTMEAVKNAFNLKLQTERHPWVMMGGSVATGFLLARLQDRFFGRPVTTDDHYAALASVPGPSSAGWERRHAPAAAPPQGGWLSILTSLFGPEISKLKASAIGGLLGVAREIVHKHLPGEVGHKIAGVFDQVTAKLGGEPLPSSALHQECSDGPSSSTAGRPGGPAFR
jgi:hypothetical protein